ncbi:hypothetical protein LN736_14895 [Clostridium sp. WLY-B-L2]|jgi:hypothetical protein|uniref:Uncharacterized protein n=1 Tax=Clostridium aromativorans TaxID=2836848 RepID=A0ABS8N8L2_9CLOT|nr:hypothetical protein [Clostridium aromativorans]MCC9296145.1 hypothetical protein [Clostridium aromativorans]
MNKLLNEIFNFKDINFPVLLAISALAMIGSLYYNTLNPAANNTVLWIMYGSSMAIAFIWSIINYVSHIKINSIYKRRDSIDSYVNTLSMNKAEKDELKTYLNDFVEDLMHNGKSKEEAVRHAISQFQVEEFNSLSKESNYLWISSHVYLIGYAISALMLSAIMFIVDVVLPSFWFSAVGWISLMYSMGFAFLMFIYYFANKIILKMMKR